MINVPPVNTPLVDPKTGMMTAPWKGWFRTLYSQLAQGQSGTAGLAKLTTTQGSISVINGIVTSLVPPK